MERETSSSLGEPPLSSLLLSRVDDMGAETENRRVESTATDSGSILRRRSAAHSALATRDSDGVSEEARRRNASKLRRGGAEESVEKDVDCVGAELRDLAAEDAGAMGRQLDFARLGQKSLGPRDELSLQGRLAGQTVLQRGAAEQDRGGFVFRRHATSPP